MHEYKHLPGHQPLLLLVAITDVDHHKHGAHRIVFLSAHATSVHWYQTSAECGAGADPAIIKAMAEAAKKSSHDGHDSNAHVVDALAALQKHGHDEAKEEHHSGGLFGLFGH